MPQILTYLPEENKTQKQTKNTPLPILQLLAKFLT